MKSVKELFEMEAQLAQGIADFTEEEYWDACEEQEGVRRCDECGKLMVDGIVWGDGEHVECVACKDESTTPEAWEKAYANDEAYWTSWEEEK